MVKLRAEKTTRNADDYKILMVGIVTALFIMSLPVALSRFTGQGWYQDLAHLTSTHDDQLLYSSVDNNRIQILFEKTLTKRYFKSENLFGFSQKDNGINYQVPGSNPPVYHEKSESWGMWILRVSDNPNKHSKEIP